MTVSILLGIFPQPSLLAAFGLTAQYLPLIYAIKAGDRSAFRQHLDGNMAWFRERFIYLILRSKGEILVLRSLFRRAYVRGDLVFTCANNDTRGPQIPYLARTVAASAGQQCAASNPA